jgi:hypothetical protein
VLTEQEKRNLDKAQLSASQLAEDLRQPLMYDAPRDYEIVKELVTKYYGAKISTLCDKLEAGVFE